MLQIHSDGEEIIILNSRSNWLDEKEQRELIIWFWKTKPDILRDIMCEECPEHLGEIERSSYVVSECDEVKRV